MWWVCGSLTLMMTCGREPELLSQKPQTRKKIIIIIISGVEGGG